MKLVRIPSGILCISMVLLLNLIAAWPELHELIHHDANESGHECAVTMLAHGQVDSTSVDMALVVQMAPVDFSPLSSVSIYNPVQALLPPSRGPPLASSHS